MTESLNLNLIMPNLVAFLVFMAGLILRPNLSLISILDSNIFSRHHESINQAGECTAQHTIITRDKGYLVVGFISFLVNTTFPQLYILKYSNENIIKFRINIEINFQFYSIHRVQETNSFYHIIMVNKVYLTDDSYYVKDVKILKSGLIMKTEQIINRCVEKLSRYHLWNYIALDDEIIISECAVNGQDEEEIYYDLNYINNNSFIEEKKLYETKFYISRCSSWNPKNAAKNDLYGNVIFAGEVVLSKVPDCKFWKTAVNFPGFHTPGWNDYVFTSNFSTEPIGYNTQTTPGSFSITEDPRNYKYRWLTTYNISENWFIAMDFNNFDIFYSIIDNQDQWHDNKFKLPSSIDSSTYSGIKINSILYDNSNFLLTGYYFKNEIQLLFAAIYHNFFPFLGVATSFPNFIPSNCNTFNCLFEGKEIVSMDTGNFLIVGVSQFANSQNREWLQLIFDQSLNLKSYIRRPSKAQFSAKSSISLSDGSTIVAGSDQECLGLIQLSFNFNIKSEERIAIEDKILINSLTLGDSELFFAAGYINPYGQTIKKGIILKFSSQLSLLDFINFSFDSEIKYIVCFHKIRIYGVLISPDSNGNYFDSMIFFVDVSLNLNSISTKLLQNTILNSIEELDFKMFVGSGQQFNKYFLVIFNQDLMIVMSSNNAENNIDEILNNEIMLTTVTKTFEGNIVAGGNIQIDNQDCILILINSSLEILKYSIFGTNDNDSLNQVILLQDHNLLVTGHQSNCGFIQLYSALLNFIEENIYSDPSVTLTTISESSYESGIASGFNLKTKSLINYEYEISLICESGFRYDAENGICLEICGDNIDYGNYECDNDILSCCLENCTIKPGFQIAIDHFTLQQKCINYNSISTNAKFIIEGLYNRISILFSSDLTLCNDIEQGKANLNEILSNSNLYFQNSSNTKNFLTISKVKYSDCNALDFFFNDKNKNFIFSKNIVLDISKVGLQNKEGLSPNVTKFTFRTKDYFKLDFLNAKDSGIFVDQTQIKIIIIGCFSVILMSLLGEGVTAIFNFIGPLQIILLITLINIKPYPDSINSIINANSIISIRWNLIDVPLSTFLPTYTVDIMTNSTGIENNCLNHPSLNLVNIFLNLQVKYVVFLVYSFYFIIVYFLSFHFPYFKELVKEMKWNGFIKLFHGLNFEFMICSIMQIFINNNGDLHWLNNLSNVMAYISFIAIFLYCSKIFSLIYPKSITDLFSEEIKNQIGDLYPNIRRKELAKYHVFAYYLRRYITLLFLFQFMNNPLAQSISFFIINALYILWLIFIKPEENRLTEVCNFFLEVMIIMISASFIMLSSFQDSNDELYCSLIEFIEVLIKLATILKTGFVLLELGHSVIKKIKAIYTYKTTCPKNIKDESRHSTLRLILNRDRIRTHPPFEIVQVI